MLLRASLTVVSTRHPLVPTRGTSRAYTCHSLAPPRDTPSLFSDSLYMRERICRSGMCTPDGINIDAPPDVLATLEDGVDR